MRRRYLAAMGGRSGTTFLVDEGWEGVGIPSGWSSTTGTPNYDYSAVPLSGSESLYLSIAAAAHRCAVDFTNMDEAWFYFLMRYTNGSAPGGARNVATIALNGSTTAVANFQIAATLRFNFGAANTTLVTTVDTTYHVWLHYKKGTGANSVIDIGLSTTGIRPTSGSGYAEVLNGAATSQVGRIMLGTIVTTTNFDFIYDNVRVAATQIGDFGT